MRYADDDMNELFQRAGEGYPVKDPGSDWNAIAASLQNQVVSRPVQNKRKGNIVLVLFFSLLALLTGLLTQSDFSIHHQQKILTGNKNGQRPLPASFENDFESNSNSQLIEKNKEQNIVDFDGKQLESAKEILKANIDLRKKSPAQTSFFNENFDHQVKIRDELPQFEKKQTANSESEIAANISKKSGKFYAGFITGPQQNEVKGQGMKKTSMDIGLLGGYKFSNRLSIETGLLFSKKYYSSDGKYFHMIKPDPSMPAGAKVMNVDGRFNVWEIPVKLKYEILQRNKTVIFSSAGISSYIITKEKNNYEVMLNGNPEKMTGNYKSINHYAVASFTVSAGYEYRTGKQTTLRIEPFVQIPIRGIGIGSMPVTSAGLNIGIIWNHK